MVLMLLSGLAACKLTLPERDEAGDSNVTLLMPPQQYVGAAQVELRIEAVELHRDDGEVHRIDLDPPETVELVADELEEDPFPNAVFIDKTVRSGDYRRVRLIVDRERSFVMSTAQGEFDLVVDGGDRLDLDSDFRIEAATDEELIVDLNLHAGLVERQTDFELRPEHVVTTAATSGEVRFSDLQLATCVDPLNAGLYLYEGLDREPVGLGARADSGPFFSVWSGNLSFFALRYVPAGAYTVAWSCEAGDDVPGETSGIEFEGQENLEVEAQACSLLAFGAGRGEPGTC